jgi:hypothetical protein
MVRHLGTLMKPAPRCSQTNKSTDQACLVEPIGSFVAKRSYLQTFYFLIERNACPRAAQGNQGNPCPLTAPRPHYGPPAADRLLEKTCDASQVARGPAIGRPLVEPHAHAQSYAHTYAHAHTHTHTHTHTHAHSHTLNRTTRRPPHKESNVFYLT